MGIPLPSLYLSRADTHTIYLNKVTIPDGTTSFDAILSRPLFDEKDIGKEVPIWLSATPPPWS